MSELLKEEQAREQFTVDNDMKAEWCLSKIRNIRKEQQKQVDELNRQMNFYLEEIEKINRAAESDVGFFKAMLEPYFASKVEDGFAKSTKTQTTVKLPSGKMILKKPAPDFERNNTELLAWMKDNRPDLVKVEESPNWAELKKTINVVGESVVTADGELVPGVKVIMREEKFDVEVN